MKTEETYMKKQHFQIKTQSVVFAFCDAVLILISMAGALWVRHDFQFTIIEPQFLNSIFHYMPINLVCTLVVFRFCRFYRNLWQFAGIAEVRNIVAAALASTALQIVGMRILSLPVPRSYPLLYLILLTASVGLTHYGLRIYELEKERVQNHSSGAVRTMIVGAGQAGNMLLAEMHNSQNVSRIIPCVVDDDPAKIGSYLQGIPVVGKTDAIPELAERFRIREIIIAIPSLSTKDRQRMLEICQQTRCKVLTLPGIYQIVNGDVRVSMLREVEINDLLGRPPVKLEMESIMGYVRDKVILVTGGGGSIGSEICRQLAIHHPKKLILFDIYENNAYDIQNELRSEHSNLDLEVLIGSVRNMSRLTSIFENYHPNLVFHAAAHKHVPLMEDSPNEAVKNNVLGTWNVAVCADRYGADKMVLISTDKAVRPTNVMGASKRICELIVQSFAQHSETEFAAVRFGNVLGSNGSVVPLFRRQIAQGGPVTVTHPEIIRYFMTIPEAVNLVLQCGALARGGEIFILDMGEPVKIADLAKKMIRPSGYEPEKDIEIVYTGLRPGEKLYEELLLDLDNLKKTEHDRIFVAQQPDVDEEWLAQNMETLLDMAFHESDDIREQLRKLVPEYMPEGYEGTRPKTPALQH